MNMDKLASTARKLGTFFKVLQKIILILAIVVVCILLVLTVANAVDPSVVIGEELYVVDLGTISIELDEKYTPDNASILSYTWVLIAIFLVIAAVTYIGIGYIRRILAPMAEGEPFHPDTAKYIKKLAVMSLILGIVQNVGTMLDSAFALRSFGLDALMESGMIRSVSVNYTLELGFIIIFFVLLLVSYIFTYGAQLQQLSDETL